jgi:hypothetical protein
MQKKNNRFHTFLLSYSAKTKNYVRRIEASKEVLHSYAVALTLLFTLAFVGFAGFEKNRAFAKTETDIINQTPSTDTNPNKSKTGKQKWTDFTGSANASAYGGTIDDVSFSSENFDAQNDFATRTRAKTWKNR